MDFHIVLNEEYFGDKIMMVLSSKDEYWQKLIHLVQYRELLRLNDRVLPVHEAILEKHIGEFSEKWKTGPNPAELMNPKEIEKMMLESLVCKADFPNKLAACRSARQLCFLLLNWKHDHPIVKQINKKIDKLLEKKSPELRVFRSGSETID